MPKQMPYVAYDNRLWRVDPSNKTVETWLVSREEWFPIPYPMTANAVLRQYQKQVDNKEVVLLYPPTEVVFKVNLETGTVSIFDTETDDLEYWQEYFFNPTTDEGLWLWNEFLAFKERANLKNKPKLPMRVVPFKGLQWVDCCAAFHNLKLGKIFVGTDHPIAKQNPQWGSTKWLSPTQASNKRAHTLSLIPPVSNASTLLVGKLCQGVKVPRSNHHS